MHSTALGGKTIAEVGSNGAIGDTFVYSGGAKLATQHHYSYSNAAVIETTNPVTGAAITTDANASYAIRQEPDPLGRDLTSPPQPGLVSEPFSNPLFKDRAMPIEYTGGPSAEFGIPDWYTNMAMASWDAHLAANMHSINRDDLAAAILAHNPNVGIIASGRGVGLLAEMTRGHIENGTLTLWGEDAAKGLEMADALNDVLGDKSKILNGVIKDVTKRLNDPKHSKCKAMFNNMDPISYMANHISIGDRDSAGFSFARSQTRVAITVSDRVKGRRVASGSTVFNQDSYFFTGRVNGQNIDDVLTDGARVAAGYGYLDWSHIRQLIVLHELMHINDTAGAYEDLDSSGRNPKLNNLIRQNCF